MKSLIAMLLTVCLGICSLSEAQDSKKSTIKEREREEPKNFSVGGEIRYYNYTEPGFVSHMGLLYGMWGEWLWTSALGNGKIYGNLLYGPLVYDGQACKISGGSCVPLSATTQDIITKVNTRLEFKLNSAYYLFLGVGFRYLYDKGEGSSFYTRTGKWAYIPVGGGVNFETVMGKILIDFEYDYTVYGNVKSSLSEVSRLLNDITSNQKGGYGLVANLGMSINKSLNAYLVYESWNAGDSDIQMSGSQFFQEPANNSQSYGVKLGYLF